MYKIDFYFFCQLLQENLSYTEISEILDPNVRGFLVPTIKIFCKENYLSSRFCQSDVNKMIRAAAEEVTFFTTITSILFYYCRTVAKLRVLGSPHFTF